MKFSNHLSVTAIKRLSNDSTFNFCRASVVDAFKEIKNLSTRKATQFTDLPAKVLKNNSGIWELRL